MDLSKFCKLIRKRCPFDESRDWFFYIVAEIYHPKRGQATIEEIYLRAGEKRIKVRVFFDAQETYELWEIGQIFSSVVIEPNHLQYLLSERVYPKEEFELERKLHKERRKKEVLFLLDSIGREAQRLKTVLLILRSRFNYADLPGYEDGISKNLFGFSAPSESPTYTLKLD